MQPRRGGVKSPLTSSLKNPNPLQEGARTRHTAHGSSLTSPSLHSRHHRSNLPQPLLFRPPASHSSLLPPSASLLFGFFTVPVLFFSPCASALREAVCVVDPGGQHFAIELRKRDRGCPGWPELMETLRSHLSKVRIPEASSRIYKQECCVSFSTPVRTRRLSVSCQLP